MYMYMYNMYIPSTIPNSLKPDLEKLGNFFDESSLPTPNLWVVTLAQGLVAPLQHPLTM